MLQRMFTYLSDGSARTFADLGFRDASNAKIQVDWCLVKALNTTQFAAMAVSTMAAASYKPGGGSLAFVTTNGITLGLDSITLGTDAACNAAGETYCVWVGCCEAADSVVGTYTGDSTGGHVITTSLAGDFLLILGDDVKTPVFWTSDLDAGFAWQTNVTPATGYITSFSGTGFTLPSNTGNGTNTNLTTKAYHYLMLKKVAGVFNTLRVVPATPTDNRPLTGVGFGPDLAMVKVLGTSASMRWRTRGMVGDLSALLNNGAAETNQIQKMLTDGVELGSGANVNDQTAAHDGMWLFAAERTPYGGGGNRRLMGVGR